MSCPVSLKSILTKQGKCLAVSSLWSIPFQDDCVRRPSSLYSLHKAVHFRIDALDRGRDAIRRDGPEIEDILGFRWGRGGGLVALIVDLAQCCKQIAVCVDFDAHHPDLRRYLQYW